VLVCMCRPQQEQKKCKTMYISDHSGQPIPLKMENFGFF
jgi:hypothetical protein